MSFGLSPGDIRLAWQLASFLHEKCFTKAQGADVQYLRFGREIQSLADILQQIEAVIKHANSQRPRRPWHNHDDECRLALQPVSQAVGDFAKSLSDCEKLLNDHERFQRDAAGFIDNVIWHISTQQDVEVLRERLMLVLKPFELQLLLEIRRELQDLRRDVVEIKGVLINLTGNIKAPYDPLYTARKIEFPEIPSELISKFSTAIKINAPKDFRDLPDIPLMEGKWILENLESSSYLAAAGPSSLWASAIWELKSDVIQEYKRFDSNQLIAPPKEVISRLPDSCFSIWVAEPESLLPPNLAEQRPLEDQILEMANVSWSINGSFKPGKSGNARLQMWQLQNLQGTSTVQEFPKAKSPSFVETPSSRKSSTLADATFSQKNLLDELINAQTTSPIENPRSHTTSPSTGMRRSSTAISSTTTMFSGSSATSVIVGSRGDGTAVLFPEPPVMILFTVFEGKYTFLHLELKEHVFVNPESCDCRRNSKRECHTVVIESGNSKKSIEIRRLCALQPSEKGLYTWDLARFRFPRHPEYKHLEVLSKVKYLTLKFESVKKKEDFCEELKLLEKVRRLDNKIYLDILAQKKSRDRKPGRS
ncbi:MAG: hypothetical protein Q9214_000594 [Letrouitia sp. 1 TL-2023]